MSLFTLFHSYLLSLVYPQIGQESNALPPPPFFFSVGIYQSDDSSFMLRYLICCAVISFGVNMNGTIIRVSLH